MYDTQAPFVASYLIVRKNGKVAFVLRENTNWMNNYYGLPSGKVEKGETFTQAVIREAKEEIGIEVKSADLIPVLTMHRHGKDNGTFWVDMFFEVKKWQGEPHNAEPHMHSELAWLDVDNLPKNTIPAVAYAFKQIKAGSNYTEHGWEKN